MNKFSAIGSTLLSAVVPTTRAAAASEGTQAAYYCASPGGCASNWDLLYCDGGACWWVGCCV